MTTYTLINKKGTVVYDALNENKVKELTNKINRYGWTVRRNEWTVKENKEYRAPEVWNEGCDRENW